MDAAAGADDQEMWQLLFPEAALNWLPGEQMGSQAARQAGQAPKPMSGCNSSSDATRAAGHWPAAAAAGQPAQAQVPANGSGLASMELDQQQQQQMQQQQMQQQLQQLLQQQLYQQQQKHLQEQQREQQELQDLQRKQQQLKEQLKQEQQQQQKWDAAAGDGDGSASAASAALGMYGSMPERPLAASSFTAGRASSGRGKGAAQQHQAQQQQQQQQHDDEPEPDLSRLSVMQRYHARRKLSMQRMERQVQEKMAQLGLLEQENRRLKWRAHILENMLLDIDKQLEVMSASDAAPDATQWLTLLGMGGGGGGGTQRRVARTVHRMLEGASSVDVSSWSVADCRKRWLAFLQALKPLVEEAEAAQAAHRAAQPQPQQEQTSSAGSRRPRRAAAAAAAAVIQQEAADVLGVAPLRSTSGGTIPEPPPPPPPPSSSGSAMDQQLDPQQLQQSHSGCSSGSDGGSLPPAHAASVEGVPAPLLARIDELVLTNFYWLLAMMSTQPVLTYEFISTDLLEGLQPLPPQESSLWSDAITRVRPSLEQLQECSSCIQVSRRCMAKVLEERAEIQASMANGLESEMHSRSNLGDSMLQLNSRDAAVERMRSNVRKESVVRNMVGFYCINVFSLFQLAQVSLACSPWFCMAWRVVGAVEERLAAQLAEPAPGSNARSGSSTHNTRSSARLAAQR